MTYISSSELETAMGTNDYNMCLSTATGSTADADIVASVLSRTDNIIDGYSTRLSSTVKKELAYAIAMYLSYRRRGPMLSDKIKWEYEQAISELKSHRVITPRATYVPRDEPTQDWLDAQIQTIDDYSND